MCAKLWALSPDDAGRFATEWPALERWGRASFWTAGASPERAARTYDCLATARDGKVQFEQELQKQSVPAFLAWLREQPERVAAPLCVPEQHVASGGAGRHL